MKTQESNSKKYLIRKGTTVTIKNEPQKTENGVVETYKATVTLKHSVEKLQPLDFSDNDEIAQFIGNINFDDPQMKLGIEDESDQSA